MSAGQDHRIDVLDEVLDGVLSSQDSHKWWKPWARTDAPVGTDLFAVVDVLDAQPVVRRSLSDPATPETARKNLTHGLFDRKISEQAVTVVAEATSVRWPSTRVFTDALEREGVRAVLIGAREAGQLGDVEDELFRFGRLVAGDRALRAAISDRSVPLAVRQQLVTDLLTGRATEATSVLARRAVAARERNFDTTITTYVTWAAAEQNRVVAMVRVARPLTEEQTERLRATLSRQAGREVVMQVVIDPAVIGGVRVEMGEQVIEGTVAGRLDGARRLF